MDSRISAIKQVYLAGEKNQTFLTYIEIQKKIVVLTVNTWPEKLSSQLINRRYVVRPDIHVVDRIPFGGCSFHIIASSIFRLRQNFPQKA